MAILLLDIMSTLVTEPFEADVPAFFGLSLPELIRVKHPTAWLEFERGEIDEHQYAAKFFLDGRSLDVEALKQRMLASYAFMEGVEPLLEALVAKGHGLYALSNYSAWYQLIEQKLQLSRYLRWDFVSCKTGHRKPEPAAYEVALRTLNVAPAECVFVDDRSKNVAAAVALGMHGIHRTPSIDDLRRDLTALGIL